MQTCLLVLLVNRLCSTAGISIRYGLKDSANGAVKTAVELLAVVASATQDVPYLGAISGTLTEVIKIRDVSYLESALIKITEDCDRRSKGAKNNGRSSCSMSTR
jgi:hypothetical protein